MKNKRHTIFFKTRFLILMSVFTATLTAQEKRILFLGNSYTTVNDLPQMLKDVAASTGDLVAVDSNAPGGHTLEDHVFNTISQGKIAAGNWDFVVLQEQSQIPSLPEWIVEMDLYPYAQQLNASILQFSPCAETVFYMTWGRKNGDSGNCASWPPVCTYEGMDELLNQRYRTVAETNNAIVSPVGAVWNYLRQNHPEIELYHTDQSHPSPAGTYAAACTFYAAVLRKDPMQISFHSTLTPIEAGIIKAAAKTVVFDALPEWFIGTYDPVAAFTHNATGALVGFTENAQNEETYLWDFGDGNSSIEPNPQYTYNATGNYTVTLTVSHCGQVDAASQTISIATLGIEEPETNPEFRCYPTIVSDQIRIQATQNIRQMYLIDLTGRVVNLAFSPEKNSVTVDLSTFSAATYFLRVATDSGSFTTKIVKQ